MNSKVVLLAIGVVAAALFVVGRQQNSPPQTVTAVPAPQIANPQMSNVAMPLASEPAMAGVPIEAVDPSPPNYVPRKLKVFEGHWQGMDGRLLTDELARKLNYPRGMQGVLLGEVTLNAANTGLLGGDVIVKIEDFSVTSMEDFQAATREVMNRSEARITVLRKDNRPGAPAPTRGAGRRNPRFEAAVVTTPAVLRRLTLVLRAEGGLGFAQLEGAPMVLAGDPRPHGYRGACTECHPIGQGFELTPDPDLISLPPPPLAREVAARGTSPHEVRGPCEACHAVK